MMQGCNDFTPPWWEVREVRSKLPSIFFLFCPVEIMCWEIVCRACKVRAELSRDKPPPDLHPSLFCPLCQARVAICMNEKKQKEEPPNDPLEAALWLRRPVFCTQPAGHDGPCFEGLP